MSQEDEIYTQLIRLCDKFTDIEWTRGYQNIPAEENSPYGTVFITRLQEDSPLRKTKHGERVVFKTSGTGVVSVDFNTYNRHENGDYPSHYLTQVKQFLLLDHETSVDRCIGMSVKSIGDIIPTMEQRKTKWNHRAILRVEFWWAYDPTSAEIDSIDEIQGFEAPCKN